MSTSSRPPIRISVGQVLAVIFALSVIAALILPATQSARRPGRYQNEEVGEYAATPAPAAAAMPARALAAAPAEGRSDASADAAPPVQPKAQAATAGRKIIYEAHVDLVTDDLDKLEAALLRLVQARGAYVADSERAGSVGSSRRGTWKVRVPAEGYEAFVRGATGLGELTGTRAQSEDVSAEYFDLDARLNAKKVEEARLLKHLSDSTGKLEEILAVERELSRVRSEIERMQGRLAVLSNQVALATVTVSASEIRGYVPPESPTLGHRIARTFAASVESLRTVGENAILWAVALAPWSPFLVLAAVAVLWAVRRAGVTFTAAGGRGPA